MEYVKDVVTKSMFRSQNQYIYTSKVMLMY